MSTTTANLQLKKPAMSDQIRTTITDIANNLDIIDSSLAQRAKQSDVTNVQNQVNTLVLQAGNPDASSAEITQARTDLKGNSFSTIKGHIDNIEKTVSNYVNQKHFYTWAVGRLESGNLNSGFKSYISMNRVEYADKDITLSMSSYPIYEMNVHTFTYDGTTYTFTNGGSWLSRDIIIKAGTYFKVALRKPSDTTTVITDPKTSELFTAFSAFMDGGFSTITKNSTELQQGRITDKGSIFPNLKARIDNIEKSVNTFANRKYIFDWVVGRLDNGVVNTFFTYQICMNRIEYADKDITISMSDYNTYQFNIQTFNIDGTFLNGGSWLTKDYVIKQGTYYKIQLKKPADTTSVIPDARSSDMFSSFSALVDGGFNDIEASSSKTIDITGTPVFGNVFAENGNYVSTGTSYKRTDFIPVNPSEVIYYTGYVAGTDVSSYNGVAGYDKNKNFVSALVDIPTAGLSGYSALTNYKITIPSNVYYIMASCRVDIYQGAFSLVLQGNVKVALNRAINSTGSSISSGVSTNSDYATMYSTSEDSLWNKVTVKQTADYLTFTCIADTHVGLPNWDNVYNHGKVVAKLSERMGVDFSLHLGDIFTDVDDVNENLKRQVKYMQYAQNTHVPFVYVKGNHEVFVHNTGSGNYTALTDSQIWGTTNRFGRYINFVRDSANPTSLYYYFDVPDRKVRVVTLDSSSNGNAGFSDAQVTWLTNVLASVPSGYKILFFTHLPPYQDLVATVTTTIVNGTNIISVIQNFITNGGKVLAMLHGHVHVDNLVVKNGFPVIAVVCAMPGKQTVDAFPPSGSPAAWDRAYGTYTEYAFDTFCINVTTGKIEMYRFGAGNDRTYTPA